MEQRFYRVTGYDNLLGGLVESADFECDFITQVEPNTFEASHEKHIPAVNVNGNIVTIEVGSVIHPMVEEHYIEWIYLKTQNGGQVKILKPGDQPKAVFALVDDKAISAFAYCNLHGLWLKVL